MLLFFSLCLKSMAVIVAEPCCSLLFQQHCSTNHVVQRTMLFNIVSTMLFNEQCCSLLFQQCCSKTMLFKNNVVQYFFNNVQRTLLFTIVSRLLKQEKTILIEQACSLLLSLLNNAVTTLFSWLNNLVYNIVHCVQHNDISQKFQWSLGQLQFHWYISMVTHPLPSFSNQNRSPPRILKNWSLIIVEKSSPGPELLVSNSPPTHTSILLISPFVKFWSSVNI